MTRLAAGIPIPSANAAAAAVSAGNHAGDTARDMPHHIPTEASEAQVPGAGRRRPTANKVAAAHAQPGAPARRAAVGTSFTSSALLGIWLFSGRIGIGTRLRRRSEGRVCPLRRRAGIVGITELVGFVGGSGNHVTAAGPLAEINQTATFAAEGEVGLLLQNDLSARGAAKTDGPAPGHGPIVGDVRVVESRKGRGGDVASYVSTFSGGR